MTAIKNQPSGIRYWQLHQQSAISHQILAAESECGILATDQGYWQPIQLTLNQQSAITGIDGRLALAAVIGNLALAVAVWLSADA